jgi:hypothetical protein
MPLNKDQLKTEIAGIMTDMLNRDNSSSIEEFATRLSNAIDAFVKSGDGKYQIGSLQVWPTAVTSVTPVAIKIE